MGTFTVNYGGSSENKLRYDIVKDGVWNTVEYPQYQNGTAVTYDNVRKALVFKNLSMIGVEAFTKTYFKGHGKFILWMEWEMDLRLADYELTIFNTLWKGRCHYGTTIRKEIPTFKMPFYVNVEINELNGKVPIVAFRSMNNTWGAIGYLKNLWFEPIT